MRKEILTPDAKAALYKLFSSYPDINKLRKKSVFEMKFSYLESVTMFTLLEVAKVFGTEKVEVSCYTESDIGGCSRCEYQYPRLMITVREPSIGIIK